MPKRIFDTQDLIDWGIDEYYECLHIHDVTNLGMRSFEERIEIVFQAPDDQKFWRITIEHNPGAGWNSISGCGTLYSEIKKPEQSCFEAEEVRPRTIQTTVWDAISDED